MTDIEAHVQQPSPGHLITLFELDLTPLGDGTVLYFTSSKQASGADLVFRGQTYTAVDCEAKGFEITGNGPVPTPSIRLSNVGNFLGSLLADYEDLVGATVSRIRTFSTFLAGGVDAGEASYAFVTDVYSIENKQVHNKVMVEWRLSSVLDQQGRQLPGRQVLRDTCLHRYRYWNGSSFDYSKATCPYNGGSAFTATGVATTSANDRCGKGLSDCRLRFGSSAALPTRSFPGAARVRS